MFACVLVAYAFLIKLNWMIISYETARVTCELIRTRIFARVRGTHVL